ncbi:MAG: hypothetical protein LVQ96_01270 [Thermoplasmatales archaeon]|nr:hypothetical protein [Thermoplasmatales archaeon]MCW6169786.1 hypothetical protein [Thermoplasmatales archaeon]
MRTKSIAFTVLVSLVVVALLASSAGASTITATINPKDNSATVQAKMMATQEISGNSSKFKLLAEAMGSHNESFTFSSNVSVNSQVYAAFNRSVSANASSAYLQNISFQYYENQSVITSGNETHIFINTTMVFSMNVTGFIHGRTANMSWRAFNVTNNVSYNGYLLNKIEFHGMLTGRNMLNFHAFAKPLNTWDRSYNSAKNITTFTYNANTTIDYHGTFTNPMFGTVYYNATMDPAYTVVTPGYSTASGNSLTVGSAPPASSNDVYYYIAAAVVIVAVGGFLFMNMRKRR